MVGFFKRETRKDTAIRRFTHRAYPATLVSQNQGDPEERPGASQGGGVQDRPKTLAYCGRTTSISRQLGSKHETPLQNFRKCFDVAWVNHILFAAGVCVRVVSLGSTPASGTHGLGGGGGGQPIRIDAESLRQAQASAPAAKGAGGAGRVGE